MGKFVWVPESEEEKARLKAVGVKDGSRFVCWLCWTQSPSKLGVPWFLPTQNEVGMGGKADPVRCASCGDWYCLEEVPKEVPEFPGSGPVASGSVLTSTKELYALVQELKGCNPAKDDPVLLKVKDGQITKAALCKEDVLEGSCYNLRTDGVTSWED
jgi:hypothetical protein